MTQDQPRVWIVNFSGHNYGDAERFGRLEAVTVGNISKSSFDRLTFEIVQKLNGSTSSDWLLISGALVANVIAAVFWMRKHGELRALIWDWGAGGLAEGGYRQLRLTGEHLDFLISNVETILGSEGTQPPKG